MMSRQNFQLVPLDGSVQDLNSDLIQTDRNFNHYGPPDRGLLEEAKRIVSAIGETRKSGSDRVTEVEDEDLYTAEEPPSRLDQQTDAPGTSAEGNATSGFLLSEGAMGFSPSNLEEAAQLSLAIQYSMESTKRSLADEEEELHKVLELSKKMIQHVGPNHSDESSQRDQLHKGIYISLQDAIKAANTIQICVFAACSNDYIGVKIALEKRITMKMVEERLVHSCLKRMSEFHKRCVEVIERKHAVDIQVQGTVVTVSGFKEYVAEALQDVKQLLEKMSSTLSDSEIRRTIQWVQREPASSATTPYPPEVIVLIENAWQMKRKKVEVLLNNQSHVIDFEEMREYNTTSGTSVKICRKMLSSQDLHTDVPEEECSLLSNLPEVSKVDEGSDEFRDVVKNFFRGIHEYNGKIRIIQVEKVMNRLLYNQYRLKKGSMLQSAKVPDVERTLYHGTSETSVKEICIHGFNRSFCGKNATIFGQGVYFAVNSSTAVQDQYSPPNVDGHRFVFVSKVLTGDFAVGHSSMKTPPLKPSSAIPLRYDSVTNNITRPTIFVVFNDTQVYPEYLITFQKL